ncbi:MAG: helix-hairpin-helix domain-containing protein [Bacilli bacterium]|nr:helix-hairpin-helix domain-containing protein [Bacilli bacterium]
MKTILIIVAITAVALVGFGAAYAMVNATVTPPSGATLVSEDPNALTAAIAGEVNFPGTYVLKPGASMLDLINAAQGTTGNADSLAFNTDYVVENKGTYFIAPLYDNSNTCSNTPIIKTNINADDVDTLQSVAGFTKTVANAIVSYRSSAPFKAIEEIKNVSGIGAATYEKVKAKITLRSA